MSAGLSVKTVHDLGVEWIRSLLFQGCKDAAAPWTHNLAKDPKVEAALVVSRCALRTYRMHKIYRMSQLCGEHCIFFAR